MSKRKPIDPKELKVGDTVEWVESDGFVWTTEVHDIRTHGILVDSGYGKTALFAPNSEDNSKYTLLVGDMEMRDYIRYPKKKTEKKANQQDIAPAKFYVGDIVECVEDDGVIWDVEVLKVVGDAVTVSYSWDRRTFLPRAKDGKHMLFLGVELSDGVFIRHPKKKAKKAKKK
jgi:hypothetical protein